MIHVLHIYLLVGLFLGVLVAPQNRHLGIVGAIFVGVWMIVGWGIVAVMAISMLACPPLRRFLADHGLTMNGKTFDA